MHLVVIVCIQLFYTILFLIVFNFPLVFKILLLSVEIYLYKLKLWNLFINKFKNKLMTMPYSKRSTSQFEINISMRNRKPSWRERKERERERQTGRQRETERQRESHANWESTIPSTLQSNQYVSIWWWHERAAIKRTRHTTPAIVSHDLLLTSGCQWPHHV